jgi:hypothetical protein
MASKSYSNPVKGIVEYAKKRGKEIKALSLTELTIDGVEANIAGQKLKFIANIERKAAWKLYVELYTRIATQELKDNQGFLREALTSLHDIFKITREILKEAGPNVAEGEQSLGFYAMSILNMELRPFLSKWHPQLSEWENKRTDDFSAIKHELKWRKNKKMRRELNMLRSSLMQYCNALSKLAGI